MGISGLVGVELARGLGPDPDQQAGDPDRHEDDGQTGEEERDRGDPRLQFR
jgi:hypothetical protein